MSSTAVVNSPYRTDVSKVYNTLTSYHTDATMSGSSGTAFTLSQAAYEVLRTGPSVTVHYTLIWTSKGTGTNVLIDFPQAPEPSATNLGGPICHLDHTLTNTYAGLVLNQLTNNGAGKLRIAPRGINTSTGAIAAQITVALAGTTGVACGTLCYGAEFNS